MKKFTLGTLLIALLSAPGCALDAVSSGESFDTETCPSCVDADFHVQVTTDPGLGARMTVIYQATDDSFGCTDLVWDGLNPKRVAEQYRQDLQPVQAAEGPEGELVYDFTFPMGGGEGCGSKIRHIYLEPSDRAEVAEPWASLSLIDSDDYENEAQTVECSDLDGVIMCGNDLLYHTMQGRSQVHLVWQ
jgi:hypothetical protein